MAKAFVRPATAADADQIAQLQISTWQVAYAKIVPTSVLGASDVGLELAAAQWHSAITDPPSPAHRVLVATDESPTGSWLTGFAASSPADDDDTVELATTENVLAINTLLVAPRWGRRGHGSRLLAATIDLARESGFTNAVVWVLERDIASTKFFRSAGWEPDGVARTLDMDGAAVNEIRLVTTW